MKTVFSRIVVAGAAAFGCAFGAFADGVSVTPGCDFTNAVMRVTAAQDASIAITLNGVSVTPTSSSYVGSEYVYNLAVSAGSVYDYAVTVGEGSPTTGEFLAANVGDAFASSSAGNTNGSWEPTLVFNQGVATVSEATFAVDNSLPAGRVVIVENVMSFVEGFEADDLADLPYDGAQAMVVVVANEDTNQLEWRVWRGGTAAESLDAWMPLSGVTPQPNVQYTVRSEFDYTSATPWVSVLVKEGSGAFVRLSNDNNVWFALSDTTKTSISSVDICGNVAFTSLTGKTSDANLFTDGATEYATAAAALQSGNALTLLADASVQPTARGKWAITAGGHTLTPYGTDALQSEYEGGYLRAFAAKEAKIGTTEYVFLDEAFAAAADNATVTLMTDIAETAATTLGKPLSLDLAGHDYLPTAALTLGTYPFVITNTVPNAGCVKFAALTDESSALKVAGGLWEGKTYGLADSFTYYTLTTPVERDNTTFAYQAKQSESLAIYDSEVKVEEDFIAANIPGADTMTAAQKAEALAESRTEGNGLPLIQCYALSLNPSDATAKPVATTASSEDAAKMTLSLNNVRVNADCGLPVKFALKTASSPDMTGATTGEAQTEATFVADLPTSGDNVKYYAIDIQFGE